MTTSALLTTTQVLKMRTTIQKAAPKPQKKVISYGMPAYRLNGMLVYFAAFKSHIGFMPRQLGMISFKKNFPDIKPARLETISFNKPLPLHLFT